jgi:beta-mannan synthase
VELECQDWARKKINIKYEIRNNRKGYKAGALKKGMEHIYARQCDFVAIFDADFQPESDFLLKTIPFLVHTQRLHLYKHVGNSVRINTPSVSKILSRASSF